MKYNAVSITVNEVSAPASVEIHGGMTARAKTCAKAMGRVSKQFVISPQYDDARQFSEGLALVRRGDRLGYIDRRGREVVALQYAFGESFSEGLAPVMPHGATVWGYVDKTGKMVVEPRFNRAKEFSEGLAAVEVKVAKGGRTEPLWGFIDRGGVWAVEPQYIGASRFSEGLANVRREDGWGFHR
jgi:hypothetical protein